MTYNNKRIRLALVVLLLKSAENNMIQNLESWKTW